MMYQYRSTSFGSETMHSVRVHVDDISLEARITVPRLGEVPYSYIQRQLRRDVMAAIEAYIFKEENEAA